MKVCASVATICMQHMSMCVFVYIYTCNVFTAVLTIVSQLFVHSLLSVWCNVMMYCTDQIPFSPIPSRRVHKIFLAQS